MSQPNIVYILADDMGYGDMGCNNPDSRIPTPNLDALAERGMRFTDAHAGSSVCTPSRYNVLTGRYCWRSRLKRGIVWEWDGALLEPERPTVASFLRDRGYRTACIGKWHLGLDWPTRDGSHPNDTVPFGHNDAETAQNRHALNERIDLSGRIGGGPVDRGFDSYFGVDVPNFPPYAWLEDDRLTEEPTQQKPERMYGHPGRAVPGWSLEAMIPAFTRRAVELIERQAREPEPLFLYFPLTSPHSPIVPNDAFKGMSGAGNYGDFVCELDWVVGEVTGALERAGIRDETLLVFTSDNGPEHQTPDDEGCWERARTRGHYSMGPWRGIKRDAWEGGHRVPLIASWPERIAAGTRCDAPVCLGDLFATCAEIVGEPPPPGAAEDSVSMLPLLTQSGPGRREAIHHSMQGKFALRADEWVLIDAPSGADNEEPEWFRAERGYVDHGLEGELFDLENDPQQRDNRYAAEPERVARMRERLEAAKARAERAGEAADGERLTE